MQGSPQKPVNCVLYKAKEHEGSVSSLCLNKVSASAQVCFICSSDTDHSHNCIFQCYVHISICVEEIYVVIRTLHYHCKGIF